MLSHIFFFFFSSSGHSRVSFHLPTLCSANTVLGGLCRKDDLPSPMWSRMCSRKNKWLKDMTILYLKWWKRNKNLLGGMEGSSCKGTDWLVWEGLPYKTDIDLSFNLTAQQQILKQSILMVLIVPFKLFTFYLNLGGWLHISSADLSNNYCRFSETSFPYCFISLALASWKTVTISSHHWIITNSFIFFLLW